MDIKILYAPSFFDETTNIGELESFKDKTLTLKKNSKTNLQTLYKDGWRIVQTVNILNDVSQLFLEKD